MNTDGFSSIQTMLLMLVVSLFVAGIGVGISLTQNYFMHNKYLHEDIDMMRTTIQEIKTQFEEDPTPASDSVTDPVWTYIDSKSENYQHLELKDVSSRINPNWVRSVFLERTELKRFFKAGSTQEAFKEHRTQTGYRIDINAAYSDLIAEDALEAFFTPYGYLNVNTAYEYVLQDMYELLTGNTGAASAFHSYIAEALTQKRIISSDEFRSAVAADYDTVFPLIGTLPEMNVHYVPEFLLEQVLNYPYGDEVIENSQALLSTLISLRINGEISPEELLGLIETKELQERVFHHLGTKTWFWKVNIATKRTAAEAIIICVPLEEDNYDYRVYSFREIQDQD